MQSDEDELRDVVGQIDAINALLALPVPEHYLEGADWLGGDDVETERWQSVPAPTMDQVALSPSLQRSIDASEDLRTDDYIDPNSAHNLEAVAALRALRTQRQSAEP